MAEHTPGPWGCVHTSYHCHDYRLTQPNGTHLPFNAPCNDHSEQRANARLIAAAPELLEALWLMRNAATALHHIHNDSNSDEVDEAHAEYAQAEELFHKLIRKLQEVK